MPESAREMIILPSGYGIDGRVVGGWSLKWADVSENRDSGRGQAGYPENTASHGG